jgi:mannosylglycerate hydrolase
VPTLHVFAHTHWDREWYQPFESFRMQLVAVVRQVLEEMEAGELPRFYLDGQAVIFDDVLAVEPQLRPRLEAQMRSGKLTAGPWYVLADQMLVGGESLIRNLSFGIKTTSTLGPVSMVGYCPDTFGHTQDLPRILNGFGIENAVVWRGAPLLEMGPVFAWRSPDKSRVLAYHLTRGYYQTAFHEMGAAATDTASGINALADYVTDWVNGLPSNKDIGISHKPMDAVLMPVGGDHTAPPSGFASLLKQLNDRLKQRSVQLRVKCVSLPEYLKEVLQSVTNKQSQADSGVGKYADVQSVEGELRFNRYAPLYERGYLLYGVLSTRLYLKRANRLAEYRLVNRCEPVFAWLAALGATAYPQAELEHVWKMLLKNHPHDSICGCSVDSVHREMETRSAKIEQALDCLMGRAAQVVAGVDVGAPVSNDDPAYGSDRIVVFNSAATPVRIPTYIRWWTELNASASESESRGHSEYLQIESKQKVDKLYSGWGSVPYYKEVMEYEGWVWPKVIPGLGLVSMEWPVKNAEKSVAEQPVAEQPVAGKHVAEKHVAEKRVNAGRHKRTSAGGDGTAVAEAVPVVVNGRNVSNGSLAVSVSAGGQIVVSHKVADGVDTYRINHQFRDIGDGGDSYNFDPIPDDKPITARFLHVRPGKSGPLVGSIFVTYELELPKKAVPVSHSLKRLTQDLGKIEILKRSNQRIRVLITAEVLLKRGVPIVFFSTEFDNPAADHRLEVIFDTESVVKITHSENHFSLVERHHGGQELRQKLPVPVAHEALPDRFPCQRFFIANGQLFLNLGMPEYGVEGSQVTITLLRAVSWLSKPRLWTRGGGAGPNLAVPEANSTGLNRVAYGWAPLGPKNLVARNLLVDEATVRAYELAELYGDPTWAAFSKGTNWETGSIFMFDNRAVRAVGCYMDGGELFLRLLNVTREPQNVNISFRPGIFAQINQVQLSGIPVPGVAWKKGPIALSFGENQLLTLRFNLC